MGSGGGLADGPSNLGDGILEARNGANEQFGLERLKAAFSATRGENALTTRNRILKELDRFVKGIPQRDDVTVVAIKFK